MKVKGRSYYQACRRTAGLTQEQAAEQLSVSVRTLATYESESGRVPDEIVHSMVEIYNAPLLAWWHFKHTSKLSGYLPDMNIPVSTPGDMGFQIILAHEDVGKAEKLIKAMLADEKVKTTDIDNLREFRRLVALAADRLLSAKVFGDGLLAREEVA